MASNLTVGHAYRLTSQVRDLSGNAQAEPGSVLFYFSAIQQGTATISGTITYDAGFSTGQAVTVLISTNFLTSEPSPPVFMSNPGTTLDFSVTVAAPSTYYVAAFIGDDPGQANPQAPVGAYGNFAAIFVSSGEARSGTDFSLAPDGQAPVLAFTAPAPGATLSALDFIRGTASDNFGADGDMRLAAQDLTNGLWWDPRNQLWISTTSTPLYDDAVAQAAGTPAAFSWEARVSTGSPDSVFGGLGGYLATDHQYRIYALTADFVGNVSSETAVDFLYNGPSGDVLAPAPSSISGQALGTSSIAWTWGLVQDVTSYAVFDSMAGPEIGVVSTNSFIQLDFSTNTVSLLCVASINPFGTGPRRCPAAVANLAAVRPARGPETGVDRVTWAWAANGNPEVHTSYSLTISTDGFNLNFSTPILTQSTTVQTSGLEAGTLYSARVQALNRDGIPTEFSGAGSTRTLPGPPAAPVNLGARFDRLDRAVSLSWEPAPAGFEAASFGVYRALADAATAFFRLGTASTTSFQDMPEASALYFYRVSGINAAGLEGVPSVSTGVIADLFPPATIQDLRIAERRLNLREIDLAWTAPEDDLTGVSRYILFSTTGTSGSFAGVDVATAEIPSLVSPGGNVGFMVEVATTVTTHFALRSVDGVGNESPLSNAAFIDPVPPTIAALDLAPGACSPGRDRRRGGIR